MYVFDHHGEFGWKETKKSRHNRSGAMGKDLPLCSLNKISSSYMLSQNNKRFCGRLATWLFFPRILYSMPRMNIITVNFTKMENRMLVDSPVVCSRWCLRKGLINVGRRFPPPLIQRCSSRCDPDGNIRKTTKRSTARMTHEWRLLSMKMLLSSWSFGHRKIENSFLFLLCLVCLSFVDKAWRHRELADWGTRL